MNSLVMGTWAIVEYIVPTEGWTMNSNHRKFHSIINNPNLHPAIKTPNNMNSSNYQWTSGLGSPIALHTNFAMEPRTISWFCNLFVKLGANVTGVKSGFLQQNRECLH